MSQLFYTSFWKLVLVSIVIVSAVGCDSILPDEFKKKDYTNSEIDQRACVLLSRDTITNAQGITTGYRVLGDSVLAWNLGRFRKTIIDSVTLADSTENRSILPYFDTLVDSLEQLSPDSVLLVRYPADQRVSFAVLKVLPGQSRDITIYASLQYNADNVNEYVDIQLLKRDTTFVPLVSDMPGEAVSGGTLTITYQSAPWIIPIIKARNKYHVEEGVYLVRFSVTTPATVGPFKILIF
jgi:hypothetical protein